LILYVLQNLMSEDYIQWSKIIKMMQNNVRKYNHGANSVVLTVTSTVDIFVKEIFKIVDW
jgi:hypothetical protein